MIKTDPTALSTTDRKTMSTQVHSFMDSMRTTCIVFTISFVVIVFFIVGPFRPESNAYLMTARFAVAVMLVYAIYTNGYAIADLYSIKGIFSLNSMHDIRVNLYMCILFTILMVVLVGVLVYKNFK
jgi:uncharacterized membrane protein YidH (DUF202 family)